MHDPFWSELKGVRGKWERVVVVHLPSFLAMHILNKDLARRLLFMSPVQNENLQLCWAVALLPYIVSWWHGRGASEWKDSSLDPGFAFYPFVKLSRVENAQTCCSNTTGCCIIMNTSTLLYATMCTPLFL